MRIKHSGNTVKIWASTRDTYAWAHAPGAAWPCSVISGNSLLIELQGGDLVDITMNGKYCDIPVNELNAFIEDMLDVN